jgi:hypothetical protein
MTYLNLKSQYQIIQEKNKNLNKKTKETKIKDNQKGI